MTDSSQPPTADDPFDVSTAPPQLQEALRRMSRRGPVVDQGTGKRVAVDGRLVTDGPSEQSVVRIRRRFDGYAGLYGPSVVTDAASLLDAYLATAAQHGLDETAANDEGWLTLAAAESTVARYRRPATERTSTDLSRLRSALTAAFTAEGLHVVPTPVRMGVGVAPVPGGPTWGAADGLAVAIYSDSGWELMLNSTRTPSHSVYAPVTEAGADEVAQLVHGVLRGDLPDPFRRRL